MAVVRLNTVTKVNRFLASIINQLNDNKISAEKARALGYLCTELIRGIEKAELEKRIEELEKMVQAQHE